MEADFDYFSPPPPRTGQSILWKMLTIASLIIGLLIPLGFIEHLIVERQETKLELQKSIGESWGGDQLVVGPILAVPYNEIGPDVDYNGHKTMSVVRKIAYLMPNDYTATGEVHADDLHPGVNATTVYATTVNAHGHFDLNVLRHLPTVPDDILWKEAFIVCGLPNSKASVNPDFIWKTQAIKLQNGLNGASFLHQGYFAPVSVSGAQEMVEFNVNLSLQGSQSLAIVPVGKQNRITLTSSGKAAHYVGDREPHTQTKAPDGLQSVWKTSSLLTVPYLTDTDARLETLTRGAVGVQMTNAIDAYRQTDRAIKYGVLFLVLTFATYFLFEVVCQARLHPFQYLLIGCALCLFYLSLLSFSEVITFAQAYLIASISTISVIVLYTRAILGRLRKSAPYTIGGLLSVLYTYLYVMLQQESYALLSGTIGLFVMLACIMYVTRNIDWYNEKTLAT